MGKLNVTAGLLNWNRSGSDSPSGVARPVRLYAATDSKGEGAEGISWNQYMDLTRENRAERTLEQDWTKYKETEGRLLQNQRFEQFRKIEEGKQQEQNRIFDDLMGAIKDADGNLPLQQNLLWSAKEIMGTMSPSRQKILQGVLATGPAEGVRRAEIYANNPRPGILDQEVSLKDNPYAYAEQQFIRQDYAAKMNKLILGQDTPVSSTIFLGTREELKEQHIKVGETNVTNLNMKPTYLLGYRAKAGEPIKVMSNDQLALQARLPEGVDSEQYFAQGRKHFVGADVTFTDSRGNMSTHKPWVRYDASPGEPTSGADLISKKQGAMPTPSAHPQAGQIDAFKAVFALGDDAPDVMDKTSKNATALATAKAVYDKYEGAFGDENVPNEYLARELEHELKLYIPDVNVRIQTVPNPKRTKSIWTLGIDINSVVRENRRIAIFPGNEVDFGVIGGKAHKYYYDRSSDQFYDGEGKAMGPYQEIMEAIERLRQND